MGLNLCKGVEGMWKKLSISLKTSLISSLVVSVLLIIAATLIIQKESGLVHYVLDQYQRMVQQTFDRQADSALIELEKEYSINTKVISGISGYFVYNFDAEGLTNVLREFMELPDIVAVSVFDNEKNPFAALWKSGQTIKIEASISDADVVSGANKSEEKIVYDGENVGTIVLYYTSRLLIAKSDASKEELEKEVTVLDEEVSGKIQSAFFFQSIIFIAVVFILVFTVFLTLRYIVVIRLTAITRGLQDIAEGEGDLTKRLQDGYNDEVGELCRWFNIFVEKIQTIIQDVAGGSQNLNSASSRLALLSDSMKNDSDQTSVKANSVSLASEEMNANMSSVAAAMEQASTNIDMVASAVEEMNSTITQIAENTETAQRITVSAVEQTKNASEQVDELGLAADSIGNVLQSIAEISEQVNLLALNATIEAARAGEAGKGFAVVANEIKDLAGQTAEAADEIKQRIEGIQTTTKGTTDHIEQITHVVEEVNEIVKTIALAVEEQSSATSEIATNVSQANEGLGEVNQNVSQSSVSISAISEEIGEVTQAANDISSNSAQVSENAEELSGLSNQLNVMVRKFKV